MRVCVREREIVYTKIVYTKTNSVKPLGPFKSIIIQHTTGKIYIYTTI